MCVTIASGLIIAGELSSAHLLRPLSLSDAAWPVLLRAAASQPLTCTCLHPATAPPADMEPRGADAAASPARPTPSRVAPSLLDDAATAAALQRFLDTPPSKAKMDATIAALFASPAAPPAAAPATKPAPAGESAEQLAREVRRIEGTLVQTLPSSPGAMRVPLLSTRARLRLCP